MCWFFRKLWPCACIILWSSGTLRTVHAIFRWSTEASSHVTVHILPLWFYYELFLLIQSILTSAKKAKLRELMGDVQKEEPEGEAVAGPSREAALHSSGSTLLVIFFQNFVPKYIKNLFPFFSIYPSHLLPFSFLDRWIYWGGGSMTLDKGERGH